MAFGTAYVLDFDGTITTLDISSELAAFYGGREYMRIENEYRRRLMPIKEWLQRIADLLPANLELLNSRSMQWATIRPGIDALLEKARQTNSIVVVASDGLGFYIEPILEKYGLLDQIDYIYRNDLLPGHSGRLEVHTPYAHPVCPICGNCKAAHVVRLKNRGYPVIYVGDGSNDRFGALWSDHVFARGELAENCRAYNFDYSPWIDFYDIIKIETPQIADRSEGSLCCPLGRGIKKGEVGK